MPARLWVWVPAVAALLALSIAIFPGAAAAGGAKPPAVAPSVQEGLAPDFVLHDLKGEPFRLSDWRGKQPVLIIFGTTWCSFCKAEIPHFKKIHETYGKRGLIVVNIDIQESRQKVAKFAADHKLPYRVLLDGDGTVSGVYGIRGVPAMVLIDRDGRVACFQCRDVEPRIEALLKGK